MTVFRDGLARDPRALEDPPALLAWARALARTGKREAAAEAYRALLPRSGALPTNVRVAAEIEAGLLAMSRGEAGLDEAVAALREGLLEGQDEAQSVAVLALALALDRGGSAREARAVLAEHVHGDPREALGSARAKELLAVAPGEEHALAAFALESSDAAGAREEWQRAIAESPAGPWTQHAKDRLAGLGARHGTQGGSP